MGVVLDSTVWIAAERKRLTVTQTIDELRSTLRDDFVVISALSAAELIHGVWRATTHQARAQREEFVEEILVRIPVQPVSLRIARIMGRIDATARLSGQVIPTADLISGATALDLGFAIATSNVRQFRMLPNLKVIQVL